MPKRKVTKEKGSTNKDFFTPDKIIAQPPAHAQAKKVRAIAAPPTTLFQCL